MSRPQSRSKVNLGRGACPVVKMAKGGVVKMKKGGKICPEGKATMLKRQKAENERVANGRT